MIAARTLRFALAASAFLALPLAAGGCADEGGDSVIASDTVNVYVSLPLQGARAARSESIAGGVKLALADAGGLAGAVKVNTIYLDDTAGRPPRWDPAQTADNARKAAQDSRAIAYIGELESGATRISLPVTNQASLVHVTPASTAVDLTAGGPGTPRGAPERYYPTGNRTFARVLPADDVQARAAARWAKRLGARRVLAVSDGSGFGDGLVADFDRQRRRLGMRAAGAAPLGGGGGRGAGEAARRLARAVAGSGADLVYYGGGGGRRAALLLRTLDASESRARVLGSDALLEPAFLRRLGPAAGRLLATAPVLPIARLGPAARHLARRYRRQLGAAPGPYAAYGYEAMALIIDALKRAGEGARDRRRVIEALLATRGRRSLLGTYSLTGGGDTTLGRLGGYRVRDGRPVLERELRAPR